MKKLLYISSNNVNVFNGNANAEFQRLTFLSKYFEIHYLSLSSTKVEVDNFLFSKNLVSVIVLSSDQYQLGLIIFDLTGSNKDEINIDELEQFIMNIKY